MPEPIREAKAKGHVVFERAHSANLIVVRGYGGPGDWDGMLYLAWRGPLAGWIIRAWPAATRPGVGYLTSPIHPMGGAMIAPGQYRGAYQRGLHKGRPALVQTGPVKVLRDPDRDRIHEPETPDTGLFGVNIHDITHPGGLAGCIGLNHASMTDLLRTVEALERYQGRTLSLTLLE